MVDAELFLCKPLEDYLTHDRGKTSQIQNRDYIVWYEPGDIDQMYHFTYFWDVAWI